MPLMYEENSLQMEWCLNCHRNPAKNLRPTSEIYNMAWEGASGQHPVWCAQTGKAGATAQSVACTTKDPSGNANPEIAMLLQGTPQAKAQSGTIGDARSITREGQTVSDGSPMAITMPLNYQKFSSQDDLGHFLMAQYHIRTANELASCETCHR
jgi:hypothetical protein